MIPKAPQIFVNAVQKVPIACSTSGCSGPVESVESTQLEDRIKTFQLRCEQCGWTDRIAGREQLDPPWDEASIIEMTEEHLLHLQPSCPYDSSPVHFQSLPNPRRKARYRISCYFCGRRVELDWPPQEAKW